LVFLFFFCNFAERFAGRMKQECRRIALAWLLLSVFVSMLLLSGVHRHEAVANTADDCVECAQHVHHSGHFTTLANHLDDCLLCQFLHLVYTTAATATLMALVVVTQNRRFALKNRSAQTKPSVLYTRGPPSML